jgi:glyoxylase-like metal-dependent hydrolase (beta-lactamase superfamily II)
LADVSEVAARVYMIDERLYSLPQWGSVFLLDEDKKALIDSGPSTSSRYVLDGIRAAGVRPADIDYIIVTHVHLDHSGAAGGLLEEMPRAQVVVHHKGARHLTDPRRLLASTIEAQGAAADARLGEVRPVDPARVQAVREGDTITLSDKQVLKFMETPGHAPHELCIYESRNRGVFTGDAVALNLAGGEVFLPYHPPPAFDLEKCLATLRRLQALQAGIIYYAHFGFSTAVERDLDLAVEKLLGWHRIATEALAQGDSVGLDGRFIAQALTELGPLRGTPALYDYMADIDLALVAAGHAKYYREKGIAKELEAR